MYIINIILTIISIFTGVFCGISFISLLIKSDYFNAALYLVGLVLSVFVVITQSNDEGKK